MNTDLMFSSETVEWSTPQHLFDKLNTVYHFTLDPASTHENAKCEKHFTLEEDGLEQDWDGEVVFCNPPYGRGMSEWIKKCYYESKKGVQIVLLVPARTDTSWFHAYIVDSAVVHFIPGRLKFGGHHNSAPFPSMLVFYNIDQEDIEDAHIPKER